MDDFPGQKVNMKELDDVLIRDVGNKIRDSGKYVLFHFCISNCITYVLWLDKMYYVNGLSTGKR